MPVRRRIQSESTPIRSAIGPLGTTRSGSRWPSPTIRAVRAGANRGSRDSTAWAASDSGMDGAPLGRRLDLRAGDDALGQPREDLPRADLDEARGAGLVQRGERL